MFILDNLTDDDFQHYSWGWIAQKYEVTADKYLEYSISDLKDGHSSRHLINAISNAKKALHIRMEEIAIGFGYQDGSNKFPRMCNYVRQCGFVAPRVLDRINAHRNKVEHDYVVPSLEDVEVYIDIVTLFLASTRKWMERCVDEVKINHGVLDETGKFELESISYNWGKGEIKLSYKGSNESEDVVIDQKHPDYFRLIEMTLRNDT